MSTRRRKTVAERRHEHAEAERRVWDEFRPWLAALSSYADALKLVAEAPPPDSPGRRFFSNLGFFLQGFSTPGGSSGEERALYAQLIERLDAAGELKPGAGKQIADKLRRAAIGGC